MKLTDEDLLEAWAVAEERFKNEQIHRDMASLTWSGLLQPGNQ